VLFTLLVFNQNNLRKLATGISDKAFISECGTYRYLLTRANAVPGSDRDPAVFVMLNPSTADARLDDPTIRRCKRFAQDWGCAGLIVTNLYALRATDPTALRHHADPIGPMNDFCLRLMACEYRDVICAWGAKAPAERVERVVGLLTGPGAGARLWCLGTTKDGAPRHPLYVKATQPLVRWHYQSEGAACAT